MENALNAIVALLKDESTISAYELHSSGLVQALTNCLNTSESAMTVSQTHMHKLASERIQLFKNVFQEASDGSVSPAVALVRKLISVLESLERLPVYSYDLPSSGYGLQILTRRLRFRLKRANGESTLIDRSDRTLKMEPLTTVAALERYLLKMVVKQWYDYDRLTFNFVKKLKESNASLTFAHTRDFDENGLIHWIGTNAK